MLQRTMSSIWQSSQERGVPDTCVVVIRSRTWHAHISRRYHTRKIVFFLEISRWCLATCSTPALTSAPYFLYMYMYHDSYLCYFHSSSLNPASVLFVAMTANFFLLLVLYYRWPPPPRLSPLTQSPNPYIWRSWIPYQWGRDLIRWPTHPTPPQ